MTTEKSKESIFVHQNILGSLTRLFSVHVVIVWLFKTFILIKQDTLLKYMRCIVYLNRKGKTNSNYDDRCEGGGEFACASSVSTRKLPHRIHLCILSQLLWKPPSLLVPRLLTVQLMGCLSTLIVFRVTGLKTEERGNEEASVGEKRSTTSVCSRDVQMFCFVLKYF